MSYIEEIDLFTSESKLERKWEVSSVFIYENEIIVEFLKSRKGYNYNYYIPFVYKNKKIILQY